MSRIRVLVVDDSVVIRRLVSDVIDSDPELQVVGTAANGRIALTKVEQLQPDVITLDIEMPEMDGLATLRELRDRHVRTPVIMFSTLTERAAAATLDALSLGAADYVTKPSNAGSTEVALQRVRDDLIPKIKTFGRRSLGVMIATPLTRAAARPAVAAPVRRPVLGARPRIQIVAIGTSTGGPNALEAVFRRLNPDIGVPVVVVQHMPPVFTKILADRLSAKTAWEVHEAAHGMRLEPAHAYVAPGDFHMMVEHTAFGLGRVVLDKGPAENSCRPSVDVLFRSVAASHAASALGVVMTGMGQDGLRGCQMLVAAGAEVIAQDEATSVVWGMPGYVTRAGLASEVLPLDTIPSAIERRVRQKAATGIAPQIRVQR
ncbi:MAG TPA: chemotaxis response regulator protein-glutamate methylesterase [Acidimicrobiales bacterium]